MTVALVNPLPAALRHYQAELHHVLTQAGGHPIDVAGAVIEEDGRGMVRRSATYCRDLLATRRHHHGPAIVLWPSFGYLEVPLELLIGPRGALVFHDAQRMTTQMGMGRWQAGVASAATRVARQDVIVHSEVAATVLRDFGWRRIRQLPHPMMPMPTAASRTRHGDRLTCLVLGQHKPTRQLDLLDRLPTLLPDVRFCLAGRGWPQVPGWEVEDAFLSEHEFTARLLGADVLLLPYEHYFQSGVMVRAFELGVPVVSIRHEQPVGLFGSDWPGLVDAWNPDAVGRAIAATSSLPSTSVAALGERRMRDVVDAWSRYLTDLRKATDG